MIEETPREAHYRDLLNTVLVRLRNLPRDNKTISETQRECWRIADFIEARINRWVEVDE